jgi:hypothetical protein
MIGEQGVILHRQHDVFGGTFDLSKSHLVAVPEVAGMSACFALLKSIAHARPERFARGNNNSL